MIGLKAADTGCKAKINAVKAAPVATAFSSNWS
jgi:hypothetical protein